jgi:predicted nucleic acid-binding Zn ribbon protein
LWKSAVAERDPAPLGDLLRALVGGRGWSERIALGKLRAGWNDIVGDAVASHSHPVRLAGGTLTIAAEHPWATELSLLARSVAAKSDSHLGGGLVKEVKIVAAG